MIRTILVVILGLIHVKGSTNHVNQLKKWLKGKDTVSAIDDGNTLTFTSYGGDEETYIDKFDIPSIPSKMPCLNSSDMKGCLRKKFTKDLQLNNYNDARDYMYAYTNNYEGWIECLYGGMRMYVGQKVEGIRNNAYRNRKGFSAEHIYPKSLLPTSKSKNDIHNLYPTSAYLNTRRSTFRFINSDDKKQCQAFTDGYSVEGINKDHSYLCVPNKDNTLSLKGWEPRQSGKGDIARAVAYMIIIYEPREDIMDIDTMLKWHELDPVNSVDIQRNKKVYEMQGNFNPFILYPKLMGKVFR
jgi:endonuclease I